MRVAGQIVHAQRHYAHGAGNQLLGMSALAAVCAQVLHFALVAGIEPTLQVMFVLAKIHPGDADVGKTEFSAPMLDRLGQCGEVRCGSRHGWVRQYGLRCV
ncbi:hypothetical protein KU43P_05100 [Pseudomonas sp. KU43P]|nr:hypothetical protein KU43P_05100 [Pseudomonas sp. KU43P]